MAKCIRCGKSTLIKGHVKLSDVDICLICFKELGFDKYDAMVGYNLKYSEIKDGKDAYDRKRWAKQREAENERESERLGLHFSDYSILNKLDCSDYEIKAVERVCALLADEGCDLRRISYEREPGAPLSAFVGDNLIYELKYTKDVKWIRIAPDPEKLRITGPAGINKHVNKLVEAYRSAE